LGEKCFRLISVSVVKLIPCCSLRVGYGLSNFTHFITVHPDYFSTVHDRLRIHMLVTVDKKSRLCSLDIPVERFETIVNIILFVVNAARRIMGNKHIDWRKIGKKRLHILLFVEKMATRFVFPAAVETAESKSVVVVGSMVEIYDRVRKRNVSIMVPLDREDRITVAGVRCI